LALFPVFRNIHGGSGKFGMGDIARPIETSYSRIHALLTPHFAIAPHLLAALKLRP